MKWFIPSWNGDLRLVPDEGDKDKTVLIIEKPTPDEKRILKLMGEEFLKHKLVDSWDTEKKGFFSRKKKLVINAPLERVGPVVAKIMKQGPAVLTAITFKDGQCVTCSGSVAELTAVAEEAAQRPPEAAPEAAATVRRPTPSCPQCQPGAIGPASEVLLAFLSAEQHETWAKGRFIIVEGGLSGNRYVLAHRHSKLGQRFGRICYDLDSKSVVHFHDWSVPPEEEVLAAKLILEHREPWLRNEATMLGASDNELVFKNPFGDGLDGVSDAQLTQRIGRELYDIDWHMSRLLGAQ